jgi:hypothetical protein
MHTFDTIRYFAGVLLVVTLPPAVVWWFIIHPFVGFWRRVGARRALWANIVIMALGIVGLWFVRNPLVGRDCTPTFATRAMWRWLWAPSDTRPWPTTSAPGS